MSRCLILLGVASLWWMTASASASAESHVPLPPQPAGVAWPTEAWPEATLGPTVDAEALSRAVEGAFLAVGRGDVNDTRALLLVHGGELVFERYAEGFDRQTRFQSWSMAKSFTQALVGVLVGRGELELDAPAPVPQWQGEADPRRVITLRHLLHMTAGIDNNDGSGGEGGDAFVAQLIFGGGAYDTTRFAAVPARIHPPGTFWSYSTGTSSVIAGIVGRAVGSDRATRGAFMRQSLFAPIGMRSAAFGFDAAEHFLGGSNFYANARDYARFGLLYLRDGVWEGRRLLPKGWVDFTRTRAPADNNGAYGGHFWLNLEPKEHQFRLLPGGPSSAFAANGNSGQSILMVPTHDLIVVRLGELQSTTWKALNENLAEIVAAFPERPVALGQRVSMKAPGR